VHLNVDGSLATTNIVATTVTTSGTTTITMIPVTTSAGPTILHLLSYTGTDSILRFFRWRRFLPVTVAAGGQQRRPIH